MAQQDYVAFAFKKGSEAETRFIELNDVTNTFSHTTHRTDNGPVTLYTATLPFYRGYNTTVDLFLDLKAHLPEDQFDFVRIGDFREDYVDQTANGLIYIDGDSVTVAGEIKATRKKSSGLSKKQKDELKQHLTKRSVAMNQIFLGYFTTDVSNTVRLEDYWLEGFNTAHPIIEKNKDNRGHCEIYDAKTNILLLKI